MTASEILFLAFRIPEIQNFPTFLEVVKGVSYFGTGQGLNLC